LGTNGMALSPIAIKPNGSFQYGRVQVEIDEELLKEIAAATGGKYFRATNNEKLKEIYKEINKLEKTDVEEFKFYNYEEKFRPLVLFSGMLLLLEILLRFTIFRSFV
jgi:Ca-activated chloride channel family protein